MNIVFRKPEVNDAKDIFNLVKDTEILDVNSEYLYLLQSTHFANTCVVAQIDGDICGFVSGYILPENENVFFIWQVGVDEKYKGNGIAKKMIEHILQREELSNINEIHTTISPSNQASQRVFAKFAEAFGQGYQKETFFEKSLFNNAHEDEVLYKIKLK